MYTGISRMPKNKYYFLLMAFGLITIGIMGIEFLLNVISIDRIVDKGIQTEAIIYDKKRVHGIRGDISCFKYNMYVEYEIDGKVYNNKIVDYKGEKNIGDRIEVFCDNSDYSNVTTKQYVEKEKSKAILPIIIYIVVVIKVVYEALNCIKTKKYKQEFRNQ